MKKTSLIAALVMAMSTAAAAGPADHETTLTVLTGHKTKSGSIMAGIRIDLAQGWKTYWRAPGDAGIPPLFQWGNSDNINAIAFHWPVPEVMDQGGMRAIGYHDSVTIPIELFPNASGDMHLTGNLDIGICDEICVPATFAIDATIVTNGTRNAAISAALLNQPMTAAEASVGAVTCTLAPIDGGMQITTVAALAQTGGQEAVIIETADPYVWVSEPKVTRSATHITATSDLIHANGSSFAVDRSGIRMTVLGQGRAVDIQGCSAG